MTTAKIAITLERATLQSVDKLVRNSLYPSRSKSIQEAVSEKLERLRQGRLARECSKLDPREEQALAEEGLSAEAKQCPSNAWDGS